MAVGLPRLRLAARSVAYLLILRTVRSARRALFALVCATALLPLARAATSVAQPTRAGSPSVRAAARCKRGYVPKRVHGRQKCVKKPAPSSTAAAKARTLLVNALVDSALGPGPGEVPLPPTTVSTLAFCSTYLNIIQVGKGEERGTWKVRAGFSVSQAKGSPVPEPPFDAQGDPQGLLELTGVLFSSDTFRGVEAVSLNVKLEHGALVSAGYTYYPKWTNC